MDSTLSIEEQKENARTNRHLGGTGRLRETVLGVVVSKHCIVRLIGQLLF